MFVLLAGLRWWWGVKAERVLAAERARVRASGEPLEPEDFATSADPEAEALKALLREIDAAFDKVEGSLPSESRRSLLSLSYDLPGTFSQRRPEVVDVLAATGQIRSRLRRVAGMRSVRWSLDSGGGPSPHLNTSSVPLVCAAAVVSHQMGDEREAVGSLREAINLVRHVQARQAWISAHVSVQAAIPVAGAVEMISPSLRIRDRREPDAAGAASPEDVTALIGDLLDEQPTRDALVRAYSANRVQILEIFRARRDQHQLFVGRLTDEPIEPLISIALRPIYDLGAARHSRTISQMIEAVQRPSWHSAAERFPHLPTNWKGPRGVALATTGIGPADGLLICDMFHVLVRRRMAATALATRRFAERNGRMPETLRELVPDDLPAIPLDPFSASGEQIIYEFRAGTPGLRSRGLPAGPRRGAVRFRLAVAPIPASSSTAD